MPDSDLHGLDPGELLARALGSVQPSAWQPPSPEDLGRLLPQYRVECLLGRGGMGAVYKGWQPKLDRPVAIKLLPAEVAADATFVARFEREARTLARLNHARIVTIHASGQTEEGHLYFVMEYVDGTDLRQILRGPGLEPEQALAVVGQLCDALMAAHRAGIVHRDIKPENVLITRDGYVKLADFGLARPPEEAGQTGLTHTDVVMGTPDYMAPEQRQGASRADARSDIFALGVMFYEMLTGERPQGVFDPPSHKVEVDVRIDEVVLKALQSEPARRYQKVSELKSDVERIRSTPAAGVPRAGALRSRSRVFALGGFSAVLLAVFATLLWRKEPPAPPTPAPSPKVAVDHPAAGLQFHSIDEILDVIPNDLKLMTDGWPHAPAMTLAAEAMNTKAASHLATIRVRVDNIAKTTADLKCYARGLIVSQLETDHRRGGLSLEVSLTAFFPETAAAQMLSLKPGSETTLTGLVANAGCLAGKRKNQVRIWIDLAECSLGTEFHASTPPSMIGMKENPNFVPAAKPAPAWP